MEWRLMVKIVMPGLVPGIQVLAAFKTWMAGTKPGHDELNDFQAVRESLKMLATFSVRLSG
jgi:hypothetical protein